MSFAEMGKTRKQVISHSIVSNSLQPHGLQPTRLLCPWNSAGKNTRVGSHSLLQGIFPTQGLNLGLLHCRQILHHLSHQESPENSGSRQDIYIHIYMYIHTHIKSSIYQSGDVLGKFKLKIPSRLLNI